MPNHKSSVKRVRQTNKKREANRYYAKTMRNSLKEIRGAGNKEGVKKELSELVAMIDKMVKRGQIHKNKAANLKSGLMKKITAKAK